MSKYQISKELLEQAVTAGEPIGWNREEMLLTVLVSTIEALKDAAGAKAVVDALTYEMSNLGGDVDTGFMRSR